MSDLVLPPVKLPELVVVAKRTPIQSKMTWLNTLIAVAALLGIVLGLIPQTGQTFAIITAVIAGVNVILRVFFTGSPLTDSGLRSSQPPNISA